MSTAELLRPLAEGNRFQRAYARWALPYYERMPPDVREPAALVDQFLYSRRGLGFWFGLLAAIAGTSFGLHATGMPAWLALLLAVALWGSILLGLLAAWLQPALFSGSGLRKKGLRVLLFAALGGICGFVVGHWLRHGRLDLSLLADDFVGKFNVFMPAVLLAGAGMVGLMWGIAQARRSVLQRELERSELTRQAAEARLRLLQGQIQPHFIFNTLAALQHWVDTADPRAPGLLRSLTAFLRGSTELLGREDTSVADEAALVAHYLAIQQARLGARLATRIEIAPEVGAERLPPGVLLSLVENAVEHGITPSLSGGEVALLGTHDGRRWQVTVRDSGVGLAADARDGVGLANSRARLQHCFGPRASLTLRAAHPGTEAVISVEGRVS